MRQLIRVAAIVAVASSCSFVAGRLLNAQSVGAAQSVSGVTAKNERHLRNIRKLTSGGENAEAYFTADGTRLIYQSTRPEYPCDQIYTMKLDGSDQRRVSAGTGRTT